MLFSVDGFASLETAFSFPAIFLGAAVSEVVSAFTTLEPADSATDSELSCRPPF